MAEGKQVVDASAAQVAARKHLDGQYGSKLVELRVRKCWYSVGASRDVWDIEGTAIIKKGMFGKEQRAFRYQVDPASGAVIGFEEL